MRFAPLRTALLAARTACASRPAARVLPHGADASCATPMTNTTN